MLDKKIVGKVKLKVSKIRPLYGLIREFYYLRESKILKKAYFKARETGEAAIPEKVVFEPTAACNLNCKMCFFNRLATIKPNELTFEEIKAIFSKNEFKKVNLIGGEPMLRRDIMKILNFFDSLGMSYDISTNGTTINEANIGELAKLKGLDSIAMSLDGPEELHNAIRGSDTAYPRTIKAYQLLNKYGMVTSVVAVLVKENIPFLKDIVDIAYKNKISFVFFELERVYIKKEIEEAKKVLGIPPEDKEAFPLSITGEYERGYSLEEMRNSLREAVNYGRKKRVRVFFYPKFLMQELEKNYSRTLRKDALYTCRFLNQARIDPQGNVVHCSQLRKNFGSLKEKSFEEIWNSEEYKEFRKKLLGNNLLPICETCLNMVKIRGK